jgi:hypothetical protein
VNPAAPEPYLELDNRVSHDSQHHSLDWYQSRESRKKCRDGIERGLLEHSRQSHSRKDYRHWWRTANDTDLLPGDFGGRNQWEYNQRPLQCTDKIITHKQKDIRQTKKKTTERKENSLLVDIPWAHQNTPIDHRNIYQ